MACGFTPCFGTILTVYGMFLWWFKPFQLLLPWERHIPTCGSGVSPNRRNLGRSGSNSRRSTGTFAMAWRWLGPWKSGGLMLEGLPGAKAEVLDGNRHLRIHHICPCFEICISLLYSNFGLNMTFITFSWLSEW